MTKKELLKELFDISTSIQMNQEETKMTYMDLVSQGDCYFIEIASSVQVNQYETLNKINTIINQINK
jgi:hypothetical protein